jgi:hypothetical protein
MLSDAKFLRQKEFNCVSFSIVTDTRKHLPEKFPISASSTKDVFIFGGSP